MGYSLKNRNVLIIAGSRGLGAVVAEKFAAEGANIAISYFSDLERAKEIEASIKSQYQVKTAIIQGDAGKRDECVKTVRLATEALGGLDIVVSNAGWTKVSEFGDLYALEDEDWDRCWAVNVKSHLYAFREALPTFNNNPEGGVFIITSSLAGLGPGGSSMGYSVAKSASKLGNNYCGISSKVDILVGIHLAKCLAKSQGPKVRINAVCPGLLLTEWAERFPQEAVDKYISQAVLKRPVEVDDTADLYITLAKNTSMTGKALAIDAGYDIH